MISLPFLDLKFDQAILYTMDGEVLEYTQSSDELSQFLENNDFICINRPYLAEKYHLNLSNGLDLLELFNFLYPTLSIAPNLNNLCQFFKIDATEPPFSITLILEAIIERYQKLEGKELAFKNRLVNLLDSANWGWAVFLKSLLDIPNESTNLASFFNMLLVRLEEWEETPPYPDKIHHPITPKDATDKLEEFLTSKKHSEIRDSQKTYTSQITEIFSGHHHKAIFAEAETGTGKTLGYLAPAIAWAKKNNQPVWISTFTKNLQNQIISEIESLPDKEIKTTVRKGRENYLCLLNLEELTKLNVNSKEHIFSVAMLLNWVHHSDSGDIKGADFPSWMIQIIGEQYFHSLTDRQGECIYSACPHFSKCFIEKNIQSAKHSDLIIANHALTLLQQIFADPNDSMPLTHLIFDEAHHLFSTADQSFSANLSGWEMSEIRKWVQGQSSNFSLIRSRRRGLKKRLQEFIDEDTTLSKMISELIKATQFLPQDQWGERLKAGNTTTVSEVFLSGLYQVIEQSDTRIHPHYHTELPLILESLDEDFIHQASELKSAFETLVSQAKKLDEYLADKLKKESGELHTRLKNKLLAVQKSLSKKLIFPIKGWCEILNSIITQTPDTQFVDWIEISHYDSGYQDLGIHRHWDDPLKPFHQLFESTAKGIAFTSATLSDSKALDQQMPDHPDQFQTGFHAFEKSHKSLYAFHPSPFDYQKQAKIIIVTDVDKQDMNQISGAYLSLIKAVGGSTLGIFTAIQRLQSVHQSIAYHLNQAEIQTYAQHVDPIHPAALIELFKNDPNACLLGTDAIRDGIDIPGDDLKCIIFDRVPWPRPTHLHKQRRKIASKSQYDDTLTRFKLKQAFGRLIRSKKDSGIFILLDSQIPSRLLKAFPEEIEIQKMSLHDAVETCKKQFNPAMMKQLVS